MFTKKTHTHAPPVERQAKEPPVKKPPRQQTVIGPGVHIKGDINGLSDMELKGTIEGNVQLDGLLVVGDGGKITGDIAAESVVLQGEVLGNIDAREKATLCSNSRMKGNLRANALSIQEGALFEGKVSELPKQSEARELRHAHAPEYKSEPVYS
jgi:cytoskeletal protein CcmA (bactofilin family)